MLVDNFAKPLMEKVFKELGGTVMGYKSIPKPDPTILISIKESVGNHLKSSDWAQNLKLKSRDRNNSESHKVQRWKIYIKWMMD